LEGERERERERYTAARGKMCVTQQSDMEYQLYILPVHGWLSYPISSRNVSIMSAHHEA